MDGGTPRTVAKAYAYVVRGGAELLVFREAADEAAGVQVPKGGVEPGEDPREAVVRETREEAGLADFDDVTHLASDRWPHPYKEKVYRRHFFRLDVPDAPDRWTHEVGGDGADAGEEYRFFWVDLPPETELARGMDDYVDELFTDD